MAGRLSEGDLERAAEAIADEQGLDGVTMSSVAARLGVRPPSLYGHVADRGGLLDRLSAHALERLADDLSVAVAGRSGPAALRAFADTHRTFARRSPGLWAALHRPVPPGSPAVEAGRRISSLTAAILRAHPIPDDDLVHATRLLGSAVNGWIALEHAGGFAHSTPDADASWTRALQALDALFDAWPTAASSAPAKETSR